MRVDLEYYSERIFHITHLIRFFTRIILSYRHSLLSAVFNYPFDHALDIRVLNAEMEHARRDVIEYRNRFIVLLELEKLDADPIRCNHMGYLELLVSLAENILIAIHIIYHTMSISSGSGPVNHLLFRKWSLKSPVIHGLLCRFFLRTPLKIRIANQLLSSVQNTALKANTVP